MAMQRATYITVWDSFTEIRLPCLIDRGQFPPMLYSIENTEQFNRYRKCNEEYVELADGYHLFDFTFDKDPIFP